MIAFIKPRLQFFFPGSPDLSVLIQIDYERSKTREDVFELVHKWMDKAETTEDDSLSFRYEAASKCLYSILTNKSYESKLYI